MYNLIKIIHLTAHKKNIYLFIIISVGIYHLDKSILLHYICVLNFNVYYFLYKLYFNFYIDSS